jgi:hypothetical protein
MKNLKENYSLLLILVAFLNFTVHHSQERVSLSFYQDGKLLLLGDNHKNKSGTLDLLVRIKIQGKQKRFGYFLIMPEYEQANLQETYKRYSLNIGYTFNRFYLKNLNFVKNIELTASIGYGKIDHFAQSTYDWSVTGEIAYKVNDWLKLGIINQITERTDLLYRYNDNVIRYSCFFGLEFSPFNFGRKNSNTCYTSL